MNWSFGHGLGQTEFEGQLFGAASAAADCLKALVPFFFFAAIRNKMWSQATAASLLWVVITGYSMTSALGMAAQARFDKAGQRTQVNQIYQGLRADLKRAEEQAGWNPQHRPYEAVSSAIESHKSQPGWKWSNGCRDVSSKAEQKYCQGLHNLEAELASAKAAVASEARIAEIKVKLADMEGTTALSEADPQAKVLTALASAYFPNVKLESVQMAMTVFVALLLEIGSGFGMYVAFSQWRLYDGHVPAAPRFARAAEEDTVAATVAAPALSAVAVPVKKPRSGANDNKTIEKPAERPAIEARAAEAKVVEAKPETKVEAKAAPARLVAPETDVQRFYKESIEVQDGSSVTATQLYEDYCSWCETKSKEPLALPSFGREFADLGVKKERIAGRVRYIGIALKSDTGTEEAMKTPTYQVDAA
jgi:hypothetical protein